MSSSDIPQPHDGIIRIVFSELPQVASFFREYLPAPLVEALRWDELKLLDGTFVDDELIQAESDRLYSIPLVEKGQEDAPPVLLYILFEHQSSRDDWMPVRLLDYMCRIWKRLRSGQPIGAGLPLILPFVLSHAPGGWRVTRQFHDLFRWPKSPQLRALLERHTPQFDYALLDLIGTDLEELRGQAAVQIVLGGLKAFTEGDTGGWFVWAIPLLVSEEFMKVNPTTRRALFLYLFNVAELKPEDFRAKVAESSLSGEQTKSIMSLADYLKQEGREEGREEGLLIGQVQALQQALGQPVGSIAALGAQSKEQLEAVLAGLQRDLRARLN